MKCGGPTAAGTLVSGWIIAVTETVCSHIKMAGSMSGSIRMTRCTEKACIRGQKAPGISVSIGNTANMAGACTYVHKYLVYYRVQGLVHC